MAVPTNVKTIDTVMELAKEQTNGKIQVIATKSSTYYQEMKVPVLTSFQIILF